MTSRFLLALECSALFILVLAIILRAIKTIIGNKARDLNGNVALIISNDNDFSYKLSKCLKAEGCTSRRIPQLKTSTSSELIITVESLSSDEDFSASSRLDYILLDCTDAVVSLNDLSRLVGHELFRRLNLIKSACELGASKGAKVICIQRSTSNGPYRKCCDNIKELTRIYLNETLINYKKVNLSWCSVFRSNDLVLDNILRAMAESQSDDIDYLAKNFIVDTYTRLSQFLNESIWRKLKLLT